MIIMSKTVAIIPARSGSKGVPDKNIKLLSGKPLLAFSIAAAKLTSNIDRVILSTDSEDYADIARQYGAEVPFLRPVEISEDTSTDYDFIKHALDWFLETEGKHPEYLVHLRPTTPLREVSYIESAIEMIKNTENATALRSVHEMSESAYKTFEVEDEYLKCVGSNSFSLDAVNAPRQQFKKTYQGNGYVDVIVSSYVMESKKLHGDHVLAYITPYISEIDTEEDFEYIEYQAASNPSIISNIFGDQ